MTALPKPTRKVKAKRRPRKQRKTTRAVLAREADRLWSLAVRKKGRCEICDSSGGAGRRGPLQAAHGFSRRYRGTRWLLINGFCLCAGCHVSMTHDPLRWDDYLREMWGPEVYQTLKRMAQAGSRWGDLETNLARLREEPEA